MQCIEKPDSLKGLEPAKLPYNCLYCVWGCIQSGQGVICNNFQAENAKYWRELEQLKKKIKMILYKHSANPSDWQEVTLLLSKYQEKFATPRECIGYETKTVSTSSDTDL